MSFHKISIKLIKIRFLKTIWEFIDTSNVNYFSIKSVLKY